MPQGFAFQRDSLVAEVDCTEATYSLQARQNPDYAPSRPFKVYVLGRFQVFKDDAPIRFSRRQQRKPLELLQALIAFGGTEVGAGKLTDELWPDSEGDAAYHALESALYRLRQLLGAPRAVAMAGGKLTLDRRQFWVDMWAFECELRAGHAHDSPAERLARMRQLYSGHFLAHEPEKTWAVERRQILRERFVRAVGEFARSYESQGLWQEAADVYRVGIEVDSLVEGFHRGLIMCHRELGEHGAAVQAYRRCSELLLKMLGVQPSSKTLELYRRVRQEAISQAV
jgi:LuxR family maltose regulon positive regulatory protein